VRTRSAQQFAEVALWTAMVAAFVAVTGLWGVTIAGVLAGSHPAVASTSVPTFTGAGDAILSRSWTDITTSTSGCLFARSDSGRQVVMRSATGSLLTAAQAKNCTK
jgi:hypothetical protein